MVNVMIIFVLLCLFCRKTDADGMNCPDNFTQFEERCYKYIPTLATWHEARVTCLEDYDADLISLDGHSIFDHVQANFGGQSFVGATDVAQEGTFVWTNGLLVTGGWIYGEPNYLGIENCVVITEEGLNNLECELSRAFICEKRDCSSGYSLFEGICIKCPASYIRFENTCYRYYHTKVSWYEARQTCIGDGGDLVSLNEHAFFDHIVTFTMTKDTEVNVGANDLTWEGVFVWSNGEPVTDGWSGGEPNDEAYWGGEDCVSLSPWLGLIDIPCSINFGTVAFICERNVAILSTTTSSTTAVHSTAGHSNTTSSGPAVTFSMTNHSNTTTETTITPSIINRTNTTTEETIRTHSMINGLNKTAKWTIATHYLTSLTNKTTKATITTPAISAFLNITKRKQFVSQSLSIGTSTQRAPDNTTATTDGSYASSSVSNTSSTAESSTHSVDTARRPSTPNVADAFSNATRAKLPSPITTTASTLVASASVTNSENTTTIKTVTTNTTITISRTPLMMPTASTVVSTTPTAYTTLESTTATHFSILAPTTAAVFTNTSPSGPFTGDAKGGDSKLLIGLVLGAAVLSVILAAVSVWIILKFLNNTSRVWEA